jgi:FAD:protein FMN transferase
MAKNKLRWWHLPFLLLLIVGTALIIKTHHIVPYQKNSGLVFGTTYHVTYQSDSDYNKEIQAVLAGVDASLSPFNTNSIISHINRNESMNTDTLFRQVFNLSEQISSETDGAFDITVAPLVNIWGFGFKHSDKISAQVIDSLRGFVGYRNVTLVKGMIHKKDPRTMLDCSAIAKGFGSDQVALFFNKKGIKNYLIEIGGEIVAKGKNPTNKSWRIGVDKPIDDSLALKTSIMTTLRLSDVALATSGNYRNFYYKNGKKYAHTIDPHTGYPVQHSILSTTVLAPTCAEADGFATSFMVLGLEKTKKVLSHHPELNVYIIYADSKGSMKTFYTPALKNLIEE